VRGGLAVFGGAGLAHDLAALDGFGLACWFLGVAVGQAEHLGVLLAGGEHGLVAAEVERDGVLGQVNAVGIFQLGLDLGNGPVPPSAARSAGGL
jgi:hypothetical protein